MAPMVVIAKVPKCERTSSGCGSASGMHPMALVPWEAHDVVLEFRAERRVLDRVNLTLVAILVVKHDHTRSTRAEMRVVIDAEENIHHHVALGNRSKKAAHEILPS